MKNITKITIISIVGLLSFSGCATSMKSICKTQDANGNCISKIKPRADIHTKSYQLRITPIVGSRQEDAKIIMNMGKVIKVWIAPYKDNGALVSSHDNYVIAQKADFIIGENIPKRNYKGLITPTGSVPFLFRSADLDNVDDLKSKDIKSYNNNIYSQENDLKVAKKRLKDTNLYDKEIKEFLNR